VALTKRWLSGFLPLNSKMATDGSIRVILNKGTDSHIWGIGFRSLYLVLCFVTTKNEAQSTKHKEPS
jgi:hypothetical protein